MTATTTRARTPGDAAALARGTFPSREDIRSLLERTDDGRALASVHFLIDARFRRLERAAQERRRAA